MLPHGKLEAACLTGQLQHVPLLRLYTMYYNHFYIIT